MSVTQAKPGVLSWLKLAVAWTIFRVVRLCERVLPPSLLSLLLWLPAAIFDLLQVRQRTPLTSWPRFPRSWQPARWRYLLRQAMGLYHSQLFYMWPDRLTEKRWRSRCRFEGLENLDATNQANRGAVLASLHFGPFEVMPYWLRANGIVTTSVRTTPPAVFKKLTDYQYSLSPPADVPLFLYAEDLTPMPRFSHIRTLVGPGRRLLVMVDPVRGLQVDIPFEDRIFRMSTGAIRIAEMAQADLIPCLIVETSAWQFTIHFGKPVPREFLGRSPDMQSIGAHLLREFSQVVRRYPAQCKMRLSRSMWPLPEDLASTHSAPTKD